MQNEFLSEKKWAELRNAIALSLTPVAVMNNQEFFGVAFDVAATLLSDLGIVPESFRQDDTQALVA